MVEFHPRAYFAEFIAVLALVFAGGGEELDDPEVQRKLISLQGDQVVFHPSP